MHPTFVEHAAVSGDARRVERSRENGGSVHDIPLGRVAQPEEVAGLVAYLLGDESRFVTGAEMVIDGGMTAR